MAWAVKQRKDWTWWTWQSKEGWDLGGLAVKLEKGRIWWHGSQEKEGVGLVVKGRMGPGGLAFQIRKGVLVAELRKDWSRWSS